MSWDIGHKTFDLPYFLITSSSLHSFLMTEEINENKDWLQSLSLFHRQRTTMRMVIIAVAVHGEDDDDAYQVPINQSSRPVPEALVKRAIA